MLVFQRDLRFSSSMKSIIFASLLLSVSAFAHTHLVSSEPKAGAKLDQAPSMVMLTFSEKIEPKFSKVEVTDASGKRVDEGKLEAGGEKGEMLHAPLKELKSGKYHVTWKATSADTHKAKGKFDFTVDSSPK